MHVSIQNNTSKGNKMLVKTKLDERQIQKMEELKLHVGESTSSKAAVFAIENYCALEQQYADLSLQFDDLKQQLEQIKHFYAEKLEAEKELQALLKP